MGRTVSHYNVPGARLRTRAGRLPRAARPRAAAPKRAAARSAFLDAPGAARRPAARCCAAASHGGVCACTTASRRRRLSCVLGGRGMRRGGAEKLAERCAHSSRIAWGSGRGEQMRGGESGGIKGNARGRFRCRVAGALSLWRFVLGLVLAIARLSESGGLTRKKMYAESLAAPGWPCQAYHGVVCAAEQIDQRRHGPQVGAGWKRWTNQPELAPNKSSHRNYVPVGNTLSLLRLLVK
jgi:hypothetical protein